MDTDSISKLTSILSRLFGPSPNQGFKLLMHYKLREILELLGLCYMEGIKVMIPFIFPKQFWEKEDVYSLSEQIKELVAKELPNLDVETSTSIETHTVYTTYWTLKMRLVRRPDLGDNPDL